MRKWLAIPIVLVVIAAILVLASRGYMRHRYPYGRSHSCDKGLMFALHEYAEDHDGVYPAGEESPEASLSLLYPKYADASMLFGKIVPLEVTQARLEDGKLLTPGMCGWHYVAGLTLSDEKGLALVWDKARLGHNGERTSDRGTTVLFVDMGYKYVTGSGWDGFVAEQTALLAARKSNLRVRPTSTGDTSRVAEQMDGREPD